MQAEAFRNDLLEHHQLGKSLAASEFNLVIGKVRSLLAAGSYAKRFIVMDFLVKFIGSYHGHARAKAIYDLDIDVYLTMNLESSSERVKIVAIRLLNAYIRFLPQKPMSKNKLIMYAATVSAVSALAECKTAAAFGAWLECMHDVLLRLRSPKALGLNCDEALVHVGRFRRMKRHIHEQMQQFFVKYSGIANQCRQHNFYCFVSANYAPKQAEKVLQPSSAVTSVRLNMKGRKQHEGDHVQRQRYSSGSEEGVLPLAITATC
jgi:hypothetical protein